jgi:hypothetical protein
MDYLRLEITLEEWDIVHKQPGWEWFCENHHGACYWNSKTGEIAWLDDEEDVVYHKLNTQVQN